MSRNPITQHLFDQPDRRDLVELDVQPNSNVFMPTAEAYGEWQRAFSYFNERLFDSTLPNCLITFTRQHNVLGYFCAGAFCDEAGASAHEIAMNPEWLAGRSDAESYSTLCHELCHLWRHLSGRKNRKGRFDAPGYHSKIWGDQMEAIGLIPSHTGAPGGERTGYRMSHYIVEGGRFDLACRELLIGGATIKWRASLTPEIPPPVPGDDDATMVGITPKKNTRTRFICPTCPQKAWAAASAKLACGKCNNAAMTAG